MALSGRVRCVCVCVCVLVFAFALILVFVSRSFAACCLTCRRRAARRVVCRGKSSCIFASKERERERARPRFVTAFLTLLDLRTSVSVDERQFSVDRAVALSERRHGATALRQRAQGSALSQARRRQSRQRALARGLKQSLVGLGERRL